MTSPATDFFSQQPKTAVIALVLAVVPFLLILSVPESGATWVIIIWPFALLASLALSLFALVEGTRRKQPQGLAWVTLIITLLQIIYLANFFLGSA